MKPSFLNTDQDKEWVIYAVLIISLLSLSGFILYLEHALKIEFLREVAAIPLEILLGAVLIKIYTSKKEKKKHTRQLIFIKSYLFRSELRNLFLRNFDAMASPEVTMSSIHQADLNELIQMRESFSKIEYRSLEHMEPVVMEYVEAYDAFQGLMNLAIANNFDKIFENMILILNFINDVKLYKDCYPGKLFILHARDNPKLMDKTYLILTQGITRFLDYVIELKENFPEMCEELLADYEMCSQTLKKNNGMTAGRSGV